MKQKLTTLKTLLKMASEAERLASEGAHAERIKSLITDIRRMAQKEHELLRGTSREREIHNPTRYQLCMIGIREECDFGRATFPSTIDLRARFSRINEEIDRTIKEIQTYDRIM